MAILKKTLMALLTIALTGCYEEFTPDIESVPVLCLNSVITAGEPIEVEVSRTWLYTDQAGERDHSVPDAVVSVYANGAKVGEDYIPREGDAIRIVAESKAYGEAEAEVVVPVSVPIARLDWDAVVTSRWVSDGEGYFNRIYRLDVNVRMKIDDAPRAENYYRFAYDDFSPHWEESPDYVEWSPMKFYMGTFVYESEPIFKEHIGVFESITGADDAYGFTFFTDRQFSGKSYTLNVQFKDASFDIRTSDYSDDLLDCGYVLKLCSVSPSYYNWGVYLWNVDEGFITEFGDIGLGSPVWGCSNVSTGAGLVAAQSLSSYVIDLAEFLKAEMQKDSD